MTFRVVIPARYASTRLPGKPLRLIAGRPMLEHVFQLARRSGATEVVVATDDERIAAACARFGAAACMTDASHESGTDRIAQVARDNAWAGQDIVVNVQGDEPLLPPALIAQAAGLLGDHPEADIATLGWPIESLQEYLDPNVVKVAAARDGQALYFSRAPIPWLRDSAPAGLSSQSSYRGSMRHLGLYAYRVEALLRLAGAQPSPLECAERLEQLRALELGMRIVIARAAQRPGTGVDTEQDLARAEVELAGQD